MKFTLAFYGTRGDVEPGIAIGAELQRRGHSVRMAVTPDLVDLARSAGLEAEDFGPELRRVEEAQRSFLSPPGLLRKLRNIRHDMAARHQARQYLGATWAEMCREAAPLAKDADLLITNQLFEESALAIAESHDIPLATLHYLPVRPNGRVVSALPPFLSRTVMDAYWWLAWRVNRKADALRRRGLGLPEATGPASRRITDRGSLEIQAYDEALFPGLAGEWAGFGDRRPFVGALTLGLVTSADDEVASWIASGPPPVFFGFGSTTLESPADTLAMIGAACARVGERALVGAGLTDFSQAPSFDHMKVFDALNYAAVFPACRAVVHHGGSGTVAAGLRAGVPGLVLWTWPDQSLFGSQLRQLRVGASRHFSTVTHESLVADLRQILSPEYVTRARELCTRLRSPAESVARAADAVEGYIGKESRD